MIELVESWNEAEVDAEDALVRHEGTAEEAMTLAAAAARRAVAADGAVVVVPQGDQWVCRASVGSGVPAVGTRVPLTGSLLELSVRNRRVIAIDDLVTQPRLTPGWPRRGTAALVPISNRGRAQAVLVVHHATPQKLGAEALTRLRVLAAVAGGALARCQDRNDRQRLDGLLLRSSLGIVIFDREGTLLRANRHACAVVGRPERELLRMGWQAFAHPDQPPLGALIAEVLSGSHDATDVQLSLAQPNGSIRSVRAVISLVQRESGEVAYGVVQLEDLTESLEVAEQAQKSSALLAAFSETLPVAMGVVELLNDDLRIVSANAGLAALLNREPRVLEGRLLSELHLSATIGQQVVLAARGALDSGKVTRFELKSETTGRHFDCYAAVVEVIRNGPPMVCFAAIDTTDTHQFQTRLIDAERLATIGRLSAQIVHDLNNPVTYITSNLAMLGDELRSLTEGVPAESLEFMRDAVSEAREGATRVVSLIREVLELARPARTVRGPARVREVVEGALRMSRGQILGRARVVTELEDLPAAAIDPSRLGQVVLNLLANAAQAIPEGSGSQNVITVRGWSVQGKVFLEVKDTGCGISEAGQARLFQPFFTTKPAGVGNGLGLVSCREYVQDAGGRIDVESKVGVGSTFRLTLPIYDDVAETIPTLAVANG